jgi:hypothetical protein
VVDRERYRRQQRRRAVIGWVTAVAAVALIVLGAILGSGERRETFAILAPGYAMTSAQFEELEEGLGEEDFRDRLGQAGLSEDEVKGRYVALFPPHEAGVTCTYWKISDRLGRVARVCFDEDGKLVQKLERGPGEEPSGVSA